MLGIRVEDAVAAARNQTELVRGGDAGIVAIPEGVLAGGKDRLAAHRLIGTLTATEQNSARVISPLAH